MNLLGSRVCSDSSRFQDLRNLHDDWSRLSTHVAKTFTYVRAKQLPLTYWMMEVVISVNLCEWNFDSICAQDEDLFYSWIGVPRPMHHTIQCCGTPSVSRLGFGGKTKLFDLSNFLRFFDVCEKAFDKWTVCICQVISKRFAASFGSFKSSQEELNKFFWIV